MDDQSKTPTDASIDQLIAWMAGLRRQHPRASLASLIDAADLPIDTLVELAAVDLIHLRRTGRDVVVEDYIQQFPALSENHSALLDLIDAELCVRTELHDAKALEFYTNRFPELSAAIAQLVHLENNGQNITGQEITGQEFIAPDDQPIERQTQSQPAIAAPQSEDFLLQRELTIRERHGGQSPGGQDPERDDSIDVPIPIKPPEWMAGARCVTTALLPGGRYWLVKGRDTQRGDIVAMKILPMPSTLDRETRTRMLDLCETSSNVTHPAWIPPRIAAINNGHLAVIRPWVFGRSMHTFMADPTPKQTLATLVRLAFSIAAAHRIGATHGGIHHANVIVDHQSQPNLVDASSSVAGWNTDLSIWNNDLSRTRAERIRRDAAGLLSMIAECCIGSDDPSMTDWMVRVRKGVDLKSQEACATIGDQLQSLLDRPPPSPSWWRR